MNTCVLQLQLIEVPERSLYRPGTLPFHRQLHPPPDLAATQSVEQLLGLAEASVVAGANQQIHAGMRPVRIKQLEEVGLTVQHTGDPAVRQFLGQSVVIQRGAIGDTQNPCFVVHPLPGLRLHVSDLRFKLKLKPFNSKGKNSLVIAST